MKEVLDLCDKKFGKWTVLYEDVDRSDARQTYWICECECGNIRSVRQDNLLTGRSRSCGNRYGRYKQCSLGGNMRTSSVETNTKFTTTNDTTHEVYAESTITDNTTHEVYAESVEPIQTEIHTESTTESVHETNVSARRSFMETLYNNIYKAHDKVLQLERELSEARAQFEYTHVNAHLWLCIELRPIWQTLPSDSEFSASLDCFVKWSAENGYCPGFVLQKIDESEPHSGCNSRWVDPNPKSLSYDSIGSIEEFCKSNNLPYAEMLYHNGRLDYRFSSVKWPQNNN